MDVFEAIKRRTSVRWFKLDPVEDSLIQRILEAGTRAPTAMGMEQWFFIVVKSAEMQERIWELLKKAHIYYYSEARANKLIEEEKLRKLKERLNQGMYRAPVYVVAYLRVSRRGLREDYSEIENAWGIESVSAAIENISLAATALGLGTCWVGVVNFLEDEFNEVLRPPDGCKLIAVLPLGIPLKETNPRPRKELREVVKWI